MMKHFNRLIVFGFSLLLLQACGGGDGGGSSSSGPTYTGATSAADIDGNNSQDLSKAAVSGARQSIASSTAQGVFVPRSTPRLESKLVEISPQIAQWIAGSGAYASKTTNVSGLCSMGGSAIADTNDAETEGTITFTDCGISDGAGSVVTLTGTVTYSATLANTTIDTLEMSFHVSITYSGETSSISMTFSCVGLASGAGSCTVSSDFVGIDERVYRVTDISVSGTASSGYTISATVYDPTHGSASMTTTAPLLFDCPNGVPSTGTLVLTGANSTSASISFFDCSNYNITVNGHTTPFTW